MTDQQLQIGQTAELTALQKEVAELNRSASVNCLEWQDWERWIQEVLTDFKIPFDPHKTGMRMAITQQMIDWKSQLESMQPEIGKLKTDYDLVRKQNAALQEVLKITIIRVFTAGYAHGHEDTVEGNFIFVAKQDEATYFAEIVTEMLEDNSLPELQKALATQPEKTDG